MRSNAFFGKLTAFLTVILYIIVGALNGVPFAGKVPLDGAICASGDKGRSLRETEGSPAALDAIQAVVANILAVAG